MTERETTPPTRPESYLIAECGNTYTTVLLFDVVDGCYRLIGRSTAPTTIITPWSNLAEGIQEAITRLADATGRRLISNKKLVTPARDDSSGVDHFIFIVSAAAPLNTILVGLSEDVSLTSARRALHTVYANEVDTFGLADSRNEEEQVAAIIAHKPDLIFLTGGTDGGADQRLANFARTVSLGVNMLMGAKQVSVLYAGNIKLREQIKQIMGEIVPLHVAANVRPNLQTEQLDDAAQMIGEVYEKLKIRELPGIHIIREWSQYAPLPTARAFASIVQYFAAMQPSGARVLGLEVGTESVVLVSATADQADLTIRSDLGMGRPISNLLKHSKASAIARWTAEQIDDETVRDYIYNKALHPQTMAMSESDLHLEQAIVRELIRTAVCDTPLDWQIADPSPAPFRMLLLRGLAFNTMPRLGQVVATVLDALQPTGIFGIALDELGVLPALGALSALEPMAAVQTLESKVLTDLGWVVVPVGRGQSGQKVLHVSIESEDQQTQYEGDVEFGTLEVFFLNKGRSKVTLKPERRFDIGLGLGKGTTIHVSSGRVGLVVDARGRPLQLPQDEIARRSLIRQWYFDMGG